MASLTTDKQGNRTIEYNDRDNGRQRIRLGKVNLRHARQVKLHIEELIVAKRRSVTIEGTTADWLKGIDDKLHKRLEKLGLVTARESTIKDLELPTSTTLGDFLTGYIEGRATIKKGTRTNLNSCKRALCEYFGTDRDISTITAGDTDEWREHLSKGWAENTVRRTCGRAKQFFRFAVRKKLLTESPFADMKACNVKENRSRDYFITRDEATKVLDACPDAQWRLIFALARYGGLRCPSELLGLRWDDIDWERGRMLVRAPKTEAHEGHEERFTPIFPELAPYLQAAWDNAPEGTQRVVTKDIRGESNLRTHMHRIIKRAGLVPWPKVFVNLRATRSTELADEYPSHVCAAWLGHSTVIADKHYRQVTDEHFARAAGQNPGYTVAATSGTTRNGVNAGVRNPRESQDSRGLWPNLVPPRGFEPTSETTRNATITDAGGVNSGVVLQNLLAAVASLSPEDRATLAELLGAVGVQG